LRKTKLLLVDSSQIFCEGLANLLQDEQSIDLVWMSNTGSEAVETAKREKPDVVAIDIQSCQSDNIETIKLIREILPSGRIVAFTRSRAGADFFAALVAGATGYILKDTSFKSFIKMIALAAEGNLVITPPMAENIIEILKYTDASRYEAQANGIRLLSEQEKQVLALIVENASNKGIASTLFLSENTVKVHMRNIMHKLHARNRVEARICAIEEGLLHYVDGTDAQQA